MNRGIDYGMGQTNIDRETGIRFGVIPMHDLHEWAWESFESADEPNCPECGGNVTDEIPEDAEEPKHGCSDWYCSSCKKAFDSQECYPEQVQNWTCTDEDYKATVEDGDCFILKSPYYTRAQFCSPCAPGAGHLSNPCHDGAKTYCFGHDWFTGEKAPYPVYDVKTDERIHADGTRS